MADGGSSNFLAFVLGGVVVVLVIIGVVAFNDGRLGGTSTVTIQAPKITK